MVDVEWGLWYKLCTINTEAEVNKNKPCMELLSYINSSDMIYHFMQTNFFTVALLSAFLVLLSFFIYFAVVLFVL